MLVYNIGYKNQNGEDSSFEIKIISQYIEEERKDMINKILEKQQELKFNCIDYIDYCGDTEDEDYNCAVIYDEENDEIIAEFDTFDEAEEWVANSNGKWNENNIYAKSELE